MNDPQTPVPKQAPAIQPPAAPSVSSPSQALAIWAIFLGIFALVFVVIFPLSLPAALAAIIVGIMSLAKRRPGKGKAVTGIVTGGLTLLMMPFVIIALLLAFAGVQK